jgi:1-phosphatidylinositol-4-phosphate 5-kinase
MGLLGLESTAVLADRIFSTMDRSLQGKVSFANYMDYMDVLVHGSDVEKAEQSFRLITRGGEGPITLEMFAEMMISIMKLLNTITGNRISASQDYLRTLFQQLDPQDRGTVDEQQYIAGWKSNKKIFEWLDFFNYRLAESIHPAERKVSEDQSLYQRNIESIEEELKYCVAVLKGERAIEVPDPAKTSKTIFEVSPKEVYLDMISTPNKHNANMHLTKAMLEHQEEPPFQPAVIQEEDDEEYAVREPNRSAEISITQDIEGIEVREDFSFRESDVGKKPRASAQAANKLKLVAERLSNLLAVTARLKQARSDEEEKLPKKLLNPAGLPEGHKKETTIHWGDENWNLILNMMLGIQKAVRSISAIFDPMQSITEKEAQQIEKINLRSAFGGADVIGLRKLYRFRDYAPIVFEKIKQLQGITTKDYILSLGVEKIVQSLLIGNFSSLEERMTTGKSGSFFFYSEDGKYMLKTLSKAEFMFLRSILHHYLSHISTYPNTLIMLIYGMHKIVFPRGAKMQRLYFVVLGNLFSSDLEIHERYDLKGSTYGRLTNEKEDPSVARKDLNLLKRGAKLRLSPVQREAFLQQLTRDTDFLAAHHIIDYSLLVGIHYFSPDAERPSVLPSSVFVSEESTCLYQMGVIDTMTQYSTRKKLEHCFRSCLHPGNVVSCIPPGPYSQRFMSFMERITDIAQP